MIKYIDNGIGKPITVKLDNKVVGEIKQVTGGYQYFPKGAAGGEIFSTIQAVKNSLETD